MSGLTLVRHTVGAAALPAESQTEYRHGTGQRDATLRERYWLLLQAYLADGSETSLSRGYEFARQALIEGCSLLEVLEIHDLALFAECLCPFEMSHRGAQEGARARCDI